jgi:hypothetical protein
VSASHPSLVAGRFGQFSLVEQLASIGSEVERALSWLERGNPEYSEAAFVRALELLEVSLSSRRHGYELRELARVYELLVDYFAADNQHQSTETSWRSYFAPFTYAAQWRRGR